MDAGLVRDARTWLEQTYEDLSKDPWYQKGGWDFLRRLESEIRRYTGEQLQAIKAALGCWLRGHDQDKAVFALDLVDSLAATECLPEVEDLRAAILAGTAPLHGEWLDYVDRVLERLHGAASRQRADDR